MPPLRLPTLCHDLGSPRRTRCVIAVSNANGRAEKDGAWQVVRLVHRGEEGHASFPSLIQLGGRPGGLQLVAVELQLGKPFEEGPRNRGRAGPKKK